MTEDTLDPNEAARSDLDAQIQEDCAWLSRLESHSEGDDSQSPLWVTLLALHSHASDNNLKFKHS